VTFTEDQTNCDGTDASIISATECTIPLSTLTAAPYFLINGADVFVKVIATNSKGPAESLVGSGALIITKPDTPVSLAENVSERTVSTLGL
jgi:hypothetical protein